MPFDHKEPFYAYLIHMPRHLAPWSLLFIPALIGGIRDFKRQSRNMRFLMLGIGLIFLFFSLSGSKRHYYILPIVPFSLVFTAAYLGRGEGASADILFKIKRVLLFCLSCVTPLLVFGMMTMVLMLEFFPDFHPVFDEISGLFDDAVPMSLALALAMLSGAALLSGRRDRWLPTAILSIWLLSLFVYGYLMPRLSALRTDRKFLQEVRACLREQPQCAETLTFAGLRNVDATYYLDLPRRIPAVGVEFSAEDLIQKPQVRWLLGEKRAFENWPTAVQGNTMVLLEEDSRSWEKNDRKQAKKMQLRVLMPPMTD